MMMVCCEEFFLCLNIPLLKKESCGWFFDRITFSRFLFLTNFGEKNCFERTSGFFEKTFDSTWNQVITIFFSFFSSSFKKTDFIFFSEICFSASDVIFVEMTHLNCKISDVTGFILATNLVTFWLLFWRDLNFATTFSKRRFFLWKQKWNNRRIRNSSRHQSTTKTTQCQLKVDSSSLSLSFLTHSLTKGNSGCSQLGRYLSLSLPRECVSESEWERGRAKHRRFQLSMPGLGSHTHARTYTRSLARTHARKSNPRVVCQ